MKFICNIKDYWMQLFLLIKSASREATFLAVVAVVVLIIKILLLNRVSEKFFGAYELGLIVEAVLASVVASYIFYLLVVHLKEKSDRDILRPYIERHSNRVINNCISQLAEISRVSEVPLDLRTVLEAELLTAFSRISPYSETSMIISMSPIRYANWFQYFVYHKTMTKESIRKLFDQLLFLNAMDVSILTEIDDCSHFSSLECVFNIEFSNPNLEGWAGGFYKYCEVCRRLRS